MISEELPEVEAMLKHGLTLVVVHDDEMFIAVLHEEFSGCVPRFGQGAAMTIDEAVARATVAYSLASVPGPVAMA